MTTAHRPTWKAAVGRANEGGWTAGGAASAQVSALDAPAHLTLKTRRADGGDRKAALKKSLLELQEVEEKSGDHSKKSKKHLWKRTLDPAIEERGQQRLLKQSAENDIDVAKLKEKYDDDDIDDGGGGEGDSDASSDLDANDDSDLDADSDSDDGSSSDDDDDEDDEAALQAELAKIRAEREQARLKAEEKAAKEENARQEESALLGNPLLATDGVAAAGGGAAGGIKTKRRWNDDVVFRNQAKGEPSAKKRFINDTVRNDFHKRFLNKFIR